jgi:Uma2 family endonuclease
MNFVATFSPPRLLTADEYAQLDEVIGFRDELIEGERVLSPNPVSPHAAVIDQLRDILKAQLTKLSEEKIRVVQETGPKFHRPSSGADSVPGPDLMVVRDEEWRRAVRKRAWFEGTPLIVIAVISPSERKMRRMQKVGLYLEMGVPHVIEIDYTRRVVLVHTPDADAPSVYRTGDQISIPFQADVSTIFSVLD